MSVVWILFDEWDQGLLEGRPASLRLPNLDRLLAESLVATDARPPSRETLLSIPALLSGVPAEKGADGLPRILGQAGSDWGSGDHLFARAKAQGWDTRLVGWYHPYCRLLGDALTTCAWQPSAEIVVGRGEGFRASLIEQLLAVSPVNRRRLGIHLYEFVHSEALGWSRSGTTGLMFAHYPTPHMPSIYDADSAELSLWAPPGFRGYLGNLLLVDRAIGELRAALEASGAWNSTALLFTSDHPLRSGYPDGRRDERVPFILRLPGETAGQRLTNRFDTILTASLSLAILRGSIVSYADAVMWLRGRGGSAPRG